MKKTKSLVSLMLVVIMLSGLFAMAPFTADAYVNHTQAEALAWVQSQSGECVWNGQCAGFINAYYTYLVGYAESGDAKDYQWNDLPEGWYRTNSPTPGDIVVWGAGVYMGKYGHFANATYGHVGIVYAVNGGSMDYYDQNSAQYGHTVGIHYGHDVSSASTFIHPDFSASVFNPVDIGTDFYGSIVNLAVNKPIKIAGENVVCGVRDGSDEQKWRFERQSDTSYKIISVSNGQCLEVASAGTADNSNIRTYPSNDTPAQRWFFRSNGSGFSLVPLCAINLALDLVNGDSTEGNNIAAWTFVENNGNQIYGVDYQPSFTPVDVGTDFYGSIVNLAVNKPIKEADGNVVCGIRDGSDNQKWKFVRLDDRMYKIISVSNGKCLEIAEAGTTDNSNIRTYASNGTFAQRWYFRKNGSGYSLVSRCAQNLALDLVNGNSTEGNNIAAWTFVENNGNQIYGIDIQPSFQPQDLGDRFTASILHVDSGKAVSSNSNNNVVIQTFTGDDNQLWLFERMDDRMYKITNVAAGLCLDDENHGTTDNTNIKVIGSNNKHAQRWFLWENGNGYSFVPKCAMNLAMNLVSGDTTDGSNLAAWTRVSGNTNQIFSITPITFLQENMVTVTDVVITSDATPIEPSVTVKVNNKTLTKNTDYSVDITADIANGKGIALITGKGNYCGSITKEFSISIIPPTHETGDTNLDGHITISDVTAIQRHIAEIETFTEKQLALADTNGDGEINIADATYLQMYLAEYDVVLGKQT